jgi:hypothetical protein
MNNFKGQEFIVSLLNSTTEIETSISGRQENKTTDERQNKI